MGIFQQTDFYLPGDGEEGEVSADGQGVPEAPRMLFQPVVWMVIFLVAGYVGLRYILDEGMPA